MLTGVLSYVTGYGCSLVMMSDHICTGSLCLPVRHWVTVSFLTPLFFVLDVGETLSSRWMIPLLCVSSSSFL